MILDRETKYRIANGVLLCGLYSSWDKLYVEFSIFKTKMLIIRLLIFKSAAVVVVIEVEIPKGMSNKKV